MATTEDPRARSDSTAEWKRELYEATPERQGELFTTISGLENEPLATPDNADWVRRKRNVVAHFRRSSYAIGLRMQQAGASLADKHGLPISEYSPHGGAFPLTVAGAGVIGSITASGLPQRADHEFVVEALCAELGQDYAALALARS